MTAFKGIAAQCRQGVLNYDGVLSSLRYTRRNGNEWWSKRQIKDGSRYKGAEGFSDGEMKELRAYFAWYDKGHDDAFKFLCG